MVSRRRFHSLLVEATIWVLVGTLALGAELKLAKPARAATVGQTYYRFHKEPSDVNATYNALLPSPSVPGSDTASSATSTTNYAAGSMCKSSNLTGETFNQVSASAASTGERCMGTWISPPVGQSISVSTGDTSSMSISLYTSESTSQVSSTPKAYVYRYVGTSSTLDATPFATFSGVDPGTAVTNYTGSITPSANVTFAATDRVVVILTQNVTRAKTGASVSNYYDNNSRSPSAYLLMNYSINSPNKPTLTGSSDDDFVQAQATTGCTGNPTFNTIWTCQDPANANANASFNDEDPTPTASAGDTSGYLWLRDECGVAGTACTSPSNFGTTPSNAFMYQTLVSGYSDGNVRTVVSSPLSYTIGATNPATPYNHAGLVLWLSNTDFLEVMVYSDGVKSSINTAKVGLIIGALSTTAVQSSASLNASTNAGLYNRVWLGFAKTGTSYQAQYSTDGATWTSLGAAQNHASAFTRVGLNTFCAVSIASTNTYYGAAFDYFSYGFAAPVVTGPTVTQRMRDGKWWNNGVEQNYWLN